MALSLFSDSIDFFLEGAIVVVYMAIEPLMLAIGLIVSILALPKLNHIISKFIRLRSFAGGDCLTSWMIQWSRWWSDRVRMHRREL